ncbi:hypothetical protein [Micromonospora sp. NPDC005413]|uniref:hypothetical protein n=1 Tax=Micromonospora sp. NPDC005413 TaxID=3154563 RepID=UPI0033B0F04E
MAYRDFTKPVLIFGEKLEQHHEGAAYHQQVCRPASMEERHVYAGPDEQWNGSLASNRGLLREYRR